MHCLRRRVPECRSLSWHRSGGLGDREVQIEATGGSGQNGGSGAISSGGGTGGAGETVVATFAATPTSELWVNLGCQGGRTQCRRLVEQVLPQVGRHRLECRRPEVVERPRSVQLRLATPTRERRSNAGNLASEVYVIAGGGGGGGEGVFDIEGAGGKGGSGVTSPTGVNNLENGAGGTDADFLEYWYPTNRGNGGAGGKASSGYSPLGIGSSSHSGDQTGGGGAPATPEVRQARRGSVVAGVAPGRPSTTPAHQGA